MQVATYYVDAGQFEVRMVTSEARAVMCSDDRKRKVTVN